MKKQNKKSIKKVLIGSNEAFAQTKYDFKNAALIISVTINAYLLCIWVVLQVTTRYDAALASFFINR